VYVDGLKRLYRGQGDLTDSSNSGHALTEFLRPGETGSVVTFPQDSPYPNNSQSRQVMSFKGTGKTIGSATGLPKSDSHRTIMGWFKRSSDIEVYGIFGYGKGGTCNKAFYFLLSQSIAIHLDYWCQLEGVNTIASTTINQWYHIAAAFDGTKNIIYVNGQWKVSGEPDELPDTDVGQE